MNMVSGKYTGWILTEIIWLEAELFPPCTGTILSAPRLNFMLKFNLLRSFHRLWWVQVQIWCGKILPRVYPYRTLRNAVEMRDVVCVLVSYIQQQIAPTKPTYTMYSTEWLTSCLIFPLLPYADWKGVTPSTHVILKTQCCTSPLKNSGPGFKIPPSCFNYLLLIPCKLLSPCSPPLILDCAHYR